MASKVVKAKDTVTALALVGNSSGLVNATDPSKPFIPIKWVPQAEGIEIGMNIQVNLAKMVIVNAMSDALKKDTRVPGAEPGKYLNNDTQESFETLQLVPLYPFINRYFSKPKMSRPPVCMSVDGGGQYGVCPSGQYAAFHIPTTMVEANGVKQEVGTCATCPNSQRAWGGGNSDCMEVMQLICCSAKVIEQWESYGKRLQAGDLSVGNDILGEIFVLSFKSTSMTLGRQILERILKDGCAFKWYWTFGTATVSNEFGEWYNPTAGRIKVLDDNEKIFARSVYLFAKSMKPIHTNIEEVADEPGLDTDVKGLD